MAKPNHKFEFNFQNDISEQLEQITKHQLLPVSFVLLSDYQTEFSSLNVLEKILCKCPVKPCTGQIFDFR